MFILAGKKFKKPNQTQTNKKFSSTLNAIQKLKHGLNLIIHFKQWATFLKRH